MPRPKSSKPGIRYSPRDNDALKKVIEREIKRNGPLCDLNCVDVSGVTDFSDVLRYNPEFNGDISEWDMSNAVRTDGMFEHSNFNGDISKWNMQRVRSMNTMFKSSHFNGDISEWNVSSVESMDHMFELSNFTGDLSKWSVASVKTMHRMFSACPFNGNLAQWNVAEVRNFRHMFYAGQFNGDVSMWPFHREAQLGFMFSTEQLKTQKHATPFHWQLADIGRLPPQSPMHLFHAENDGLVRGLFPDPTDRAFALHQMWRDARSKMFELPQDNIDSTVFDVF